MAGDTARAAAADKATSPPEFWRDSYSEFFVYMPDTFFVGDHANMFPLPPEESDQGPVDVSYEVPH